MTKQEKINELKLKFPTLNKQINDEIITLDQKEYETTINDWAGAILAKEAAKLEAEQVRQTKISAYEKLGLTTAEIEALLPTPADQIE